MRESSPTLSRFSWNWLCANERRDRYRRNGAHRGDAAGEVLGVPPPTLNEFHRKVWLSYNDPAWIAQRHGLGASSAGAVEAMAKALGTIAAEATA